MRVPAFFVGTKVLSFKSWKYNYHYVKGSTKSTFNRNHPLGHIIPTTLMWKKSLAKFQRSYSQLFVVNGIKRIITEIGD